MPAEEITQFVTGELAEVVTRPGPVRIHLQLIDAGGEVLLDHRCQDMGLVRELKNRIWRKIRAATEPLRCGFFDQDNPGSTWVHQCTDPLEDGKLFFHVTVPGGAVRVPVCPRHRVVLEERERAYSG